MFSSSIKFWTSSCLKLFIVFLFFFLLFSIILLAIRDRNTGLSIAKGDFPVFFSAAIISASANKQCLYSSVCNRELQNSIWPGLQGAVHPFVYPAFAAVLLEPLASLPRSTAQTAFILFMLVALAASVRLQQNFIPLFRNCYFYSLGGMLLFAPLTFGVFGSQNTALSLFCYSAFIVLVYQERTWKDWSAGAVLGFWLFKPHYPLFMLLLLLLLKRWKVLYGFTATAILLYLVGSSRFGFAWPLSWWAAVLDYYPKEMQFNSYNMVSLNGVLYHLAQVSGYQSTVINLLLPVVLSWLLILSFYLLFLRERSRLGCSWGAEKCLEWLYAAAPLMVLASPHTHFYDVSLCLFVLLREQRFGNDKAISLAILAFLGIYAVTSHREIFSAAPLSAVPLYAIWLLLRKCRAVSTVPV